MKTLSKNWITEKHIDFEYKQYILLAYLDAVSHDFEENKLYPRLSELIDHYKQLLLIKENKQNILDVFPQKIKEVKNFKIIYEKIIEDDAIMKEIEQIVDFSLPQFEHYLVEGKKIYNFIEEHLTIYPIGVQPLYCNDGYLLLKNGKNTDTKVYEYQINLFEQSDVKYRGIYVQYIDSYKKRISNTLESIKVDLIQKNIKLPNPATYAIETDMVLPLEETLLPIAKRYLVKYISTQSEGK